MAHVEPVTKDSASEVSETLHEAMRDPQAAGHDVLTLMRTLVVQGD